MQEVARRAASIAAGIGSVILGKEEVIRACVVALLAGGHIIVEDFPGVGKTLLAKSLARSIDCRFARIQFTPDLLPSDVTGVSVFNQRTGSSKSVLGHIRKYCPRRRDQPRVTQGLFSSLLSAWKSARPTIDRVTHRIDPPIMVNATQKPIVYEGTYPLPEAQLDRFMMRLSLGYPWLCEEASFTKVSHDPWLISGRCLTVRGAR
jgi:MoxR-like ATPase